MAINFNAPPYFDDFNEAKKFLRVLFRPGRAVQARELTQAQTILQNQIQRFGNHIFQDGSMVLGGQTSFDAKVNYLVLNNVYNGNQIITATFDGVLIRGNTSGAQARVIKTSGFGTSTNPKIYIKYISGTFQATEVISVVNESTNGTTSSAQIVASSFTGAASAVTIQSGIFYTKGFFVIVDQQVVITKDSTLALDTATPTCSVGLNVVESLIDENDDSSLLDNSTGSFNYLAPGADRYKIELQLSVVANPAAGTSPNKDFILLVRLEDGNIVQQVKFPAYAELEKTLARRTFDESGNYTVRPFPITIKANNSTTVKAVLDPGKAYVKGFEFETIAPTSVIVDKARDSVRVDNLPITLNYGAYVFVNNLAYFVDTRTNPTIDLYNNATPASGTKIGTAKLKVILRNTADTAGVYRAYLSNISMNSGQVFSSIRSFAVTTTTNKICGVVLTGGIAVLEESSNSNMLFPVSSNVVKTFLNTGIPPGIDASYQFYSIFTSTLSSDSATINTGDARITFIPESAKYIVYNTTTNALVTATITFNTTTQIGVTVSGGGSNNIAVVALLNFGSVSSGNFENDQRTKTYVTANLDDLTNSDPITDNSSRGRKLISSSFTTITLPVPDIDTRDITNATLANRTVKVLRFATAPTKADYSSGTDITSRYTIDNGQRDDFYDYGKLTLKTGEATPSGYVLVMYNYYTATTASRGFFTVDSYPTYDNIQTYTSTTTGQTFNLRDCIDFRPYITDTTNIVVPNPSAYMTVDYSYYLNRIDKLVVTKDKEFLVIKGTSALNPEVPPDNQDAMTLYVLTVPAYTYDTKDVRVKYIENKRYTMRDIGKLEKRIENLEYYNALNLLEQDTQSFDVTDSGGNDRFKNGFVVDNFSGHSVGDVLNTDYKCSMDFNKKQLRAPFSSENVPLATDTFTNTVKTGTLITLPYTSSIFARNPYASKVVNVNPYNFFSFIGNVDLNPSSDTWHDTTNRPDVVINNIGENDAWSSAQQPFQTEWNDWEDNWTGTQTITETSQSGAFVFDWQNNGGSIYKLNPAVTTTRVVRTGERRRTGTVTEYVPETITKVVDDKIVDIGVVPYIRSKTVRFIGKALKPNTQVYGFFDDTAITCVFDTQYQISGNPANGKTDSRGEISGTFTIPAGTFKTGSRKFKLTDSSTNNLAATTTSAETNYFAEGSLQTREKTVVSTRTMVPRRRTVEDVIAISEPLNVADYVDPLAQTFLVPSTTYPNGMFMESVDIFFQTKDVNIPVTLQIRPTQNGFPSAYDIVPFAEVTLEPYGKVSTITIDNPGSGYSVAPTITFSAPQLTNGIAPTATATVSGGNITAITITNPGYGYTSAPSVTITPVSGGTNGAASTTITNYVKTTDLATATKVATNFKFTSPVYLPPGEYAMVLITNTNKYNVYVSEIGQLNITNVDQGQIISTQPYAGSFFKSQNARTWTPVQEEDLMFTINRCSFNQTSGTVLLKNSAVSLKAYHLFKMTSQEINFGDKKVSWQYKTSTDGTTGTLASSYTDFYSNANTYLTAEKKVQNAGSLVVIATLTTSGDQVSPVIDAERMSVIAVENIINNISSVSTATTGATGFVTASTVVYVDNGQYFDNGDVIQVWEEKMKVTSGGGAIVPTGATGFVVERGYLGTGATAVSGATGVNNISKDETQKSGGGAYAKYITRRITLAEGFDSTGIKVLMSSFTPTPSSVEVYYKILTTSDSGAFEDKPYVKMTEDVVATNANIDTESRFIDRQFSAGLSGSSLTPFTVFAIKIVMKTTNKTVIPIIKDLRAIAVA